MTIGGSIALVVIGAILRYAIHWSPAHVNVQLIGLILMIGGAIGLILSLVFLMRRTSDPSAEDYEQQVHRASGPVRGASGSLHRAFGPLAELGGCSRLT